MNEESRRAPRRTPAQPILVQDCMTGEVLGQIGNVSISGMLLLARCRLQQDALYQLSFAIPDGRPPVIAGAQALWLDERNHDPLHPAVWTGMRFISLTPEQRRSLREWIEDDIAQR